MGAIAFRKKKRRFFFRSIIRLLKLTNLRGRIDLKPQPLAEKQEIPEESQTFKNILIKSKKMVSAWGGKMYFVYLPSNYRYSSGYEDKYREFVISAVSDLNIPLIDIQEEVFDTHFDPLSLFSSRMGMHYNDEGYRFVADATLKRLIVDGIVSSNSKN